MAHLNRDDLLTLVESALPVPEDHHAAVCDRCRRELASMRALLADVRDVDVPEPSPLFWEHLAARVREAVADDPPPRASWSRWLTPAWKVAFAGTAAAAVLTAVLVTRQASPPAAPASAVVPPVIDTDAGPAFDLPAGEDWELIADVAGSADFDEVSAIGEGVSPGTADAVVLELSADEQGELLRIIREELGKERSS